MSAILYNTEWENKIQWTNMWMITCINSEWLKKKNEWMLREIRTENWKHVLIQDQFGYDFYGRREILMKEGKKNFFGGKVGFIDTRRTSWRKKYFAIRGCRFWWRVDGGWRVLSMAPPSRVDSAGLNRRVCKTKFGLLNHKCDQNETFRGAKWIFWSVIEKMFLQNPIW